MKNAIEKIRNLTFGIELELSNITQEEAVKAVQEATGGHGRYVGAHLHDFRVTMPDGREWTIETDSSVFRGCETVSPVCTYDDIPMVQEVLRALRRHGAKAHASCGQHIHVGAADMTPKQIQHLVKIFYKQENILLKACGVREERIESYTHRTDRAFIARMLAIRDPDMTALGKAYYGGPIPENMHFNHYHSARYRTLNLHNLWNGHKHTVEFRLFESTTHAGEMRANILLALTMVAFALEAKASSARQRLVRETSGKYDTRVFLLRLGWIGGEFKEPRKHMLKRLAGSTAWKDGEAHGRSIAFGFRGLTVGAA